MCGQGGKRRKKGPEETHLGISNVLLAGARGQRRGRGGGTGKGADDVEDRVELVGLCENAVEAVVEAGFDLLLSSVTGESADGLHKRECRQYWSRRTEQTAQKTEK